MATDTSDRPAVAADGDSGPVPTRDLDAAERATARAVTRLNARYVALAVSLNVIVAAGLVAYDVYNDLDATRIYLTETANHAANAVHVLRSRGERRDRDVIDDACELTACEMALLARDGQVFYQSHPGIAPILRRLRWPDASTPIPSTRMMIEPELAELSGAWSLGRYSDRLTLLVIVPRRAEEEGLSRYLSYASGITGIGVLVGVAIMLAAAHWLLRKPLVRHIEALTSALVRDVRRRKAAEERANAARLEAEGHLAFLDNLLNATGEMAIVATDERGTVRLFNRAAEQVLGYEASEVVGLLDLDELLRAVAPEAATSDRDSLRPFMQGAPGEQLLQDRTGVQRIVLATTSQILDAGGAYAGTLLVFSDITEGRRVEAELRSKQLQLIQSSRMATLGEMATGLAHEINQPLNNIGLLVSRVSRRLSKTERPGPEDLAFLRDRLASIEEQVRRAAKIIDHLRIFGRAEPAPLADIDVADAVKGALDLLGEQLKLHDVDLELSLAEDLPRARGDVSRLEQVLINLIVNARFALDEHEEALREAGSPEGLTKRLAIRSRLGRFADGAEAVVLEVADNGPGMPEDVAARVFEPFFTTKEVGAGTGLGLSISYGIVKEFDGDLAVETAPGRGATFTVRLRRAEREAFA